MLNDLRAALRSPHAAQSADTGRGIVNLNMALVVAFALMAVIELTRTWFGAMHINDSAQVIVGNVQAVDRKAQIQRVGLTGDLTAGIEQAAAPLQAKVDSVNNTVTSINNTAQSIQKTVLEINGKVRSITGTAGDINSTVATLLGTVQGINGNATSINNSVHSINGSLGAVLANVQQIHEGPMPFAVANIDRNVDTVIREVTGIRSDLDDILASVRAVNGHTASICHAIIIEGVPC